MDNRIKRTNDELKADRPTLDEVKGIPRLPISILVENVMINAPIFAQLFALMWGTIP